MGFYSASIYWHYKLLDTNPVKENGKETWYLDECTTTTTWIDDERNKRGSQLPRSVPIAMNEITTAIMSFEGKDALLGDGKVVVLSAEVTDEDGKTVGSIRPYKLTITEGKNSRQCDILYKMES